MDPRTTDARFRMIFLIWASLLGGVTLFAAVVLALTTGLAGTRTPTMDPSLAGTLLIVPALSILGGIVFRRGAGPASPETTDRLGAYQNRVIVSSALQEGGGLFGLVLSLLAGQPTWALGVWGATMAAMVLTRPDREEVRRLLE
jgi:hypothetical protein